MGLLTASIDPEVENYHKAADRAVGENAGVVYELHGHVYDRLDKSLSVAVSNRVNRWLRQHLQAMAVREPEDGEI